MTMASPVDERAIVELNLASFHVETHGAATEHLVHLQFARPPLVGQHGLLRRPGPGQYLLG